MMLGRQDKVGIVCCSNGLSDSARPAVMPLENALRDFDSPDLSEDGAALTVSEDGRWLISGTVCGADGWTLQIRLDVTERYWLNRENASIQRLLWQAVPPQEMQEESGMPVFQPGNLPVG